MTSMCDELPYEEPSWSYKNLDSRFLLEILKNGTIIESRALTQKGCFMIGRNESCDFVMQHPSVSRFHAILQFCDATSSYLSEGLYVYDLNSVHGTFLNKKQLKPRQYIKLKSGYSLRFGGSSRLFVFSIPIEELNRNKSSTNFAPKDIDWGMASDASSEENENDIHDASNMVDGEVPQSVFASNPKKFIKNFFSRYDLSPDYTYEKTANDKFLSKIELPLDFLINKSVTVASNNESSRLRDAKFSCALEACKLINSFGILLSDQQNLVSKSNLSAIKLKENDFYSSDEDTFTDRTGLIEKKRIKRKIEAGEGSEQSFAMNHADTAKKIKEIDARIAVIRNELKSFVVSEQEEKNELDPLDQYMSSLQKTISLDPSSRLRLKMELKDLINEKKISEKLFKVTQPCESIKKMFEQDEQYKSKLLAQSVLLQSPVNEISSNETDLKKDIIDVSKQIKSPEHEILDASKEEITENNPQNLSTLTLEYESQTSSEKYLSKSKEAKTQQPCNNSSNLPVQPKKKAFTKKYDKYENWLPPKNQTGDGKTFLNEKFGY